MTIRLIVGFSMLEQPNIEIDRQGETETRIKELSKIEVFDV